MSEATSAEPSTTNDAASAASETIVSEEPVTTENPANLSTEYKFENEQEASGTWWDLTSSYTNKIKESAQNFDYTKISATIEQQVSTLGEKASSVSEKVNTETVKSATTNLGSYFNSMYNGIKSSVDIIQKDNIPMLAEFDAEQEQFLKMQQRRKGAAVPPWVGYHEEEKIKKQVLALSSDERNVLRDPPAGVDFAFDFDSNMPVATAMLEADTKLDDLRFKLVPKVIKEDGFWRNYFYRVSLIKQSSQLTTIDNTSVEAEKAKGEGSVSRSNRITSSEEAEYSFSPHEDEFISDHLSNYEDADEDDLSLNEEELKQIGLKKDSKKEVSPTGDAEWEAELARELQDFDMVEDAEGKLDTEGFEAELEEMLQNQ